MFTWFDQATWALQLLQLLILSSWIITNVSNPYGGGGVGVIYASVANVLSILMISFQLCPCTGGKSRGDGNLGGNCCFQTNTNNPNCCTTVACISINQVTMNSIVFILSILGCVGSFYCDPDGYGCSGGAYLGLGITSALLSAALVILHALKLGGCIKFEPRSPPPPSHLQQVQVVAPDNMTGANHYDDAGDVALLN